MLGALKGGTSRSACSASRLTPNAVPPASRRRTPASVIGGGASSAEPAIRKPVKSKQPVGKGSKPKAKKAAVKSKRSASKAPEEAQPVPFETSCERLAHDNRGVCYREGSNDPVFVADTVPGERVRAEVTKVRACRREGKQGSATRHVAAASALRWRWKRLCATTAFAKQTHPRRVLQLAAQRTCCACRLQPHACRQTELKASRQQS